MSTNQQQDTSEDKRRYLPPFKPPPVFQQIKRKPLPLPKEYPPFEDAKPITRSNRNKRLTTASELAFNDRAPPPLPSVRRSNARAGTAEKERDASEMPAPRLRPKASTFSFVEAQEANTSEEDLTGPDRKSFANRMRERALTTEKRDVPSYASNRDSSGRPLTVLYEDLSLLEGTPDSLLPSHTRPDPIPIPRSALSHEERDAQRRLDIRKRQARSPRVDLTELRLRPTPYELMMAPLPRAPYQLPPRRTEPSVPERKEAAEKRASEQYPPSRTQPESSPPRKEKIPERKESQKKPSGRAAKSEDRRRDKDKEDDCVVM